MKSLKYFILFFYPFVFFSQTVVSFDSTISKTCKKYSAIDSVTFDFVYSVRNYMEVDTNHYRIKMGVRRDQGKDNWQWPFFVIVNSGETYDKSDGTILKSYKNRKLVFNDSINKVPRFYHGNYFEFFFYQPFYKKNPCEYFDIFLAAGNNVVRLHDKKINKEPCYVFKIKFAPDKTMKDAYSILYISKKNFFVIREISVSILNGMELKDAIQYEEYDFLEIKSNKL